MAAARATSLRYLWVDALCIVQGDINDWTKESGLMGSIYNHAYVTFCSVAASMCHQGFLNRLCDQSCFPIQAAAKYSRITQSAPSSNPPQHKSRRQKSRQSHVRVHRFASWRLMEYACLDIVRTAPVYTKTLFWSFSHIHPLFGS